MMMPVPSPVPRRLGATMSPTDGSTLARMPFTSRAAPDRGAADEPDPAAGAVVGVVDEPDGDGIGVVAAPPAGAVAGVTAGESEPCLEARLTPMAAPRLPATRASTATPPTSAIVRLPARGRVPRPSPRGGEGGGGNPDGPPSPGGAGGGAARAARGVLVDAVGAGGPVLALHRAGGRADGGDLAGLGGDRLEAAAVGLLDRELAVEPAEPPEAAEPAEPEQLAAEPAAVPEVGEGPSLRGAVAGRRGVGRRRRRRLRLHRRRRSEEAGGVRIGPGESHAQPGQEEPGDDRDGDHDPGGPGASHRVRSGYCHSYVVVHRWPPSAQGWFRHRRSPLRRGRGRSPS